MLNTVNITYPTSPAAAYSFPHFWLSSGIDQREMSWELLWKCPPTGKCAFGRVYFLEGEVTLFLWNKTMWDFHVPLTEVVHIPHSCKRTHVSSSLASAKQSLAGVSSYVCWVSQERALWRRKFISELDASGEELIFPLLFCLSLLLLPRITWNLVLDFGFGSKWKKMFPSFQWPPQMLQIIYFESLDILSVPHLKWL